MRGMIFALGLAASMCAGEAVAADAPISPPSPLIDPGKVDSPSHATLARHFAVGSLKGDIGSTTLGAIARQAGGQVQSGVTGGDKLQWLCYDLPAAHQRVWLSVSGGKTMDMVTAVPLTDRDPRSSACAPNGAAALVIDDGIKLGMTRSELTARLGAPSREASGWLVYRADAKARTTVVVVHIDGDRVVFLEAFNTPAN